MTLIEKFLLTVPVAFALSVPGAAAAAVVKGNAYDDFAAAQIIDDKELSTMRGGFSVGGLNLSFSFTSITAINGIPQQTISFSTADFNKALDAKLANVGKTNPPPPVPAVIIPTVQSVLPIAVQNGTITRNVENVQTAGAPGGSTATTPLVPTLPTIPTVTVPVVNTPGVPNVQTVSNQGSGVQVTSNVQNTPPVTVNTQSVPTIQTLSNVGTTQTVQTLQTILPPTVIQNATDNAVITVAQTLNLNVTGVASAVTQAAVQAQLHQVALQNVKAFY